MNIYELYGRLRESYDQECANHRATVDVLAKLKSGEYSLDQLTVEGSNWKIDLPEEDDQTSE